MMIPVSLAVEGTLDEKVLRRLLEQIAPDNLQLTVCYVQGGRDRLRQNVPRFNIAARFKPFVILADLEREPCAPTVIKSWLPADAHPNLAFRIVVRKVESWLLADRRACASFLGVSETLLPRQPDDEPDPKLTLVNLARRSRHRHIREDVVPNADSTSQVGKNFVGQLTRFVLMDWDARRASRQSDSLYRAIRALQRFSPTLLS
ncbi:MAG: hypothetical protein AAB427_10250 [Chloroflexota bacterium]